MVHPGFDRPFRDTQPFGHFADLECGIIDQPHHLAFVFGQFVDEAVEQFAALGSFELLVRADGSFVARAKMN